MLEKEALRTQYELERKWRNLILKSDKGRRKEVVGNAYEEVTSFMNSHFNYHENLTEKANKQIQICKVLERRHSSQIRFLDIGCSSGQLVNAGGGLGWDAYGVDIDPQSIKLAKTTFPELANNFFSGAIEDVPEKEFDIAFNSDLIEHLHPDELVPFFSEVRNRLKTGGCLLTITPYRLAGPKDISKFFLPLGSEADGLHLKEYLLSELNLVYKEAGFESVETFIFHPLSKFSFAATPNRFNTSLKIVLEKLILLVPGTLRNKFVRKLASGLTFSITIARKSK